MAVVYRHIRLDNRKPFYIGIGNSEKRAYSTRGRNNHWQNIVKKCGYEVQILFDDLTYDDAKQKEIEFILLYGRYNVSNGLLCNLTDGGDGSLGYKPTEEALLKISKTSKGRVKTKEQIDKWKQNMSFTKSEETKEKIRQTLLGKKHTDERRMNQSKAQLGKKLSQETKDKISKINKGIKRGPLTYEHIEKLKESHRGIKQSEETKLKRKQTWALKRFHKDTPRQFECHKSISADDVINMLPIK
jgi:hypothetical protein